MRLNDPAVADAIKIVLDRLKVEIAVIEKTGFISYFLIVGDFIRKGREMGVTCVARGSRPVRSSLICSKSRTWTDPLRLVVRAIFESRTHQSAGH